MPDSALFPVSAGWGSCVSGKKTITLSNVLGIPSSYFSNQRLKLKLTIPTMISSFRNAWSRNFFPFLQVQAVACQEKNINSMQSFRNTFKLLFKSKIKVEINYWENDFQFPKCLIPHFFFRFCKLRQLRVWKKTITLSNVLGIPSSYFSNQRLKLKLTTGSMISSFRNAWFRTFSRFCKLRQLRVWKKNNNSIQRARNTFKLLFKSKIKVEINQWDHEFQFPECLFPHFSPFLQVEAVACLQKNNNSFQRSRTTFKLLFKSKIKVEINHSDHDFQFPECLIPHFFLRFCKFRQLRVRKKTLILSKVLGIPSSYFSNQRLKLKLTFPTMISSFRNAWFRTFFPFLQVQAVACQEKNINSIQRARKTFKLLFKSKIKVEINHWHHEFQFPECLIPHFSPFLHVEAVACLQKTIILSNVLGIPSSYVSNQRLKLKLTIGTMNSSLRNARFRTFFRFCKLRQLRVWRKNNNSIHGFRNTFKLLFKSKIKVEINHWDHEFQFPECLFPHFSPFLQVEAVACLQKNNNSFQRSRNTFKLLFKSKIKVEINHSDHDFQFPECLIPHFFFRFCKFRQLRVRKKKH